MLFYGGGGGGDVVPVAVADVVAVAGCCCGYIRCDPRPGTPCRIGSDRIDFFLCIMLSK